jgi:hypothetical protein
MIKKRTILFSLFLLISAFLVFPNSFLPVVASEDSWVTQSSVPFSDRFEIAVVNNNVYAIAKNQIAEYDVDLDAWTLKKNLPFNRTDFVLAVYNDLIYVIGGNGGLNQVYDPINETWENKTSMPTPRTQLNANVVNGKIYLIAGRTGGQKTTMDLNEVYDPETDTWSTKKPIPYPVVGYASAVVDNKIFVIGGQNEFHAPDTPLNIASTQIYDTETDTWSQGALIPNIVFHGAAGATIGINAPKRIYVMGGINKGIEGCSFNQMYNPETDKWTTGVSRMPTARAWLNVAVVNDLLYVLGGSPGLFLSFLGTNEQYTPIGFGTIAPTVQVVSPENMTYSSNNVSLVFTVSKPVEWMGYKIDNQETITITGNLTLPDNLSSGSHSLTVYVKDAFSNNGLSEVVSFNVIKKTDWFSFLIPILIMIAAVIIVLIIYNQKFKKSKITCEL